MTDKKTFWLEEFMKYQLQFQLQLQSLPRTQILLNVIIIIFFAYPSHILASSELTSYFSANTSSSKSGIGSNTNSNTVINVTSSSASSIASSTAGCTPSSSAISSPISTTSSINNKEITSGLSSSSGPSDFSYNDLMNKISANQTLQQIGKLKDKFAEAQFDALHCYGKRFDKHEYGYRSMYYASEGVSKIYSIKLKQDGSNILQAISDLNKLKDDCKQLKKLPEIENENKDLPIAGGNNLVNEANNKIFLQFIKEKYSENSPTYRIISYHLEGFMLCGKKVFTRAGGAVLFGLGISFYQRTCITPFGQAYAVYAPAVDLKILAFGLSIFREKRKESETYNQLVKLKTHIYLNDDYVVNAEFIGGGSYKEYFSRKNNSYSGSRKRQTIGMGAESSLFDESIGVVSSRAKFRFEHKAVKIARSIERFVSDQGFNQLLSTIGKPGI